MLNVPSNNLSLVLDEVSKLSDHEVIVVGGNEPQLGKNVENILLRNVLKILSLLISHLDVGADIRKNDHVDIIIVYGFSTEFLFFTYISSLFRTRNVYLLVHHNLQQAKQNALMKFLLHLYNFFGYKFIIHETLSPLKDIGFNDQQISRRLALLHPVQEVEGESKSSSDLLLEVKQNEIFKVGLIGKIRKGKRFLETLSLLTEISRKLNFLLIIGSDDVPALELTVADGVKLVDTSSHENYLAALALCDILVLNYQETDYLYRCSGVAADAVGARTYVVCPNFPLLSHQVNYPSLVGVLYDSESELEEAIKRALTLASSSEKSAFNEHYAERSASNITLLLDQSINHAKQELSLSSGLR